MKPIFLLFAGLLFNVGRAETAPVITDVSAPRQVVTAGQTLTLTVSATGTADLSYQWAHNGRPVPGATSPSLTISSASPIRDKGWYRAVVTNRLGTATSPVIFLGVATNPGEIVVMNGPNSPPTVVTGEPRAVVEIASGAEHWLALKADGTVLAGGDNQYGQCNVPAGLSNVVGIAACNYSSFALKADGTVVAWGSSSFEETAIPAGLNSVVRIVAGQVHAIALRSDGTVVGWGEYGGQPPIFHDVLGVAAGDNGSFAWKADGTVVSWGENPFGELSVPADLTDVVDLACGEDFSIALKRDGTVVGLGKSYSRASQVPEGLTDVVAISAGRYAAFALRAGGKVEVWGAEYTGLASNAPAVSLASTNVVALAAKEDLSVVLRQSDGIGEPVVTTGGTSLLVRGYSFSLWAGQAGSTGTSDGIGGAARFGYSSGPAFDRAGNLYVADYGNHSIRKVSPAGVVSTLAGHPGQSGFSDGPGPSTWFTHPTGVALDASDNVCVADAGNGLIRKITPAGIVSTIAGTYISSSTNGKGSTDGARGSARFEVPNSLAVDRVGNIYVADSSVSYLSDDSSNTVRKVTPDGFVTTLAGTPGGVGAVDGVGAAARFSTGFSGVAVDGAGNVFLADTGNHTIREISPNGVVTTFAGLAGVSGLTDGVGGAARLSAPTGLAIDSGGNLFVADAGNRVIRRITPSGVVSTVTDTSAQPIFFFGLNGVAVDNAGTLAVTAGQAIYRGLAYNAPQFASSPQSQKVALGSTVVFSANATGPDLGFQWIKDGVAIPEANSNTLVVTNAQGGSAGHYSCVATNPAGSASSAEAELLILPDARPGRITNFSVRAMVGTGDQSLNIGLVIGGATPETPLPLLLRSVGPTLATLGATNFLIDPKLEVYTDGVKISENDNWGGDAQVARVSEAVGAFPLGDVASNDSALFQPADRPGTYGLVLSGVGGTTGVALGEVYDASAANAMDGNSPRLINVSARTQVGTGSSTPIVGFVIGGDRSKTLLIRAVGPSLARLGVKGVLADPRLQLYAGSSLLRENDNWGTDAGNNAWAFAQVGAFALGPDSTDAALLITLPPGAYTAQVSGVGDTTGVALVEVFEVP